MSSRLTVVLLALMLGFELPVNFRQPYLARNLQDFWTRWHVSLSSFIRDYIYIPPMTIHQHFNADPSKPVRLISCTARIFRQMGLNTLEQFEDSPDYDPKVVLTAEIVREYLRGERGFNAKK